MENHYKNHGNISQLEMGMNKIYEFGIARFGNTVIRNLGVSANSIDW